MLASVLNGAGDRPVIVKLHPAAKQDRERDKVRSLSKSDSQIILSDANVHDILKQAIVTVSLNSTLALEGFIHRTPVILFGQAEFHHIAGQVVAPNTFPWNHSVRAVSLNICPGTFNSAACS